MTIKELRAQTGLSQGKFGAKFKIPAVNISHWEQEKRTPPEYVSYMIERIMGLEKEVEELRCGKSNKARTANTRSKEKQIR